jgi:ABC-type Fe3+-siderophore transport system permease subunit
MTTRLLALSVVIALFGALTAIALADVGFIGIVAPHFQSWGAGQVLADLVILALLSCIWMVRDASARGLNAWPFVLVTLVAGSFGPLFYLVVRERRARRPVVTAG